MQFSSERIVVVHCVLGSNLVCTSTDLAALGDIVGAVNVKYIPPQRTGVHGICSCLHYCRNVRLGVVLGNFGYGIIIWARMPLQNEIVDYYVNGQG
jgi:hypothetical protein